MVWMMFIVVQSIAQLLYSLLFILYPLREVSMLPRFLTEVAQLRYLEDHCALGGSDSLGR